MCWVIPPMLSGTRTPAPRPGCAGQPTPAQPSSGGQRSPRHPLANQAELMLLDALSWLPERVAIAARRGRPDEFARYLEGLASATIAALICPGNPANVRAPGTDRLAL